MKKSFIPLAAALLLGLSACGNTTSTPAESSVESPTSSQVGSDAVTYSVSITNKTALAAEWHLGEANRAIELDCSPVLNINQAIRDKVIVITSSDAAVVAVMGNNLVPLSAGTATITVKYGDKQDSVDVTIAESNKEPDYVTGKTLKEIWEGSDTKGQNAYLLKVEVAFFCDNKGVATSAASEYGNMLLKIDDSTNAFAYGANADMAALSYQLDTKSYKFTNKKTFLTNEDTKNIKAGDKLDVILIRADYNTTKEVCIVIRAINGKVIANGSANTDEVQVPEYTGNVAKTVYQVKGKISKFTKGDNGGEKGNFYLKSEGAKGKELQVYGASATRSALAIDANGAAKFTNPGDFLTNAATKDLKVGDEVTMLAYRADYKGTIEITGVILPNIVEAEEPEPVAATIADLKALTATVTDKVYTVSGIWEAGKNDDFGNGYLTDPATGDSIQVYGATKTATAITFDGSSGSPVFTFTNPKDSKDWDVANGQHVTMKAVYKYYNGTAEIMGVVTNNVAATTTYKASVVTPENGTVTLSKTEGIAFGEEITVTATPADGYKIGTMTVKDAQGVAHTIADNKFNATVVNEVEVKFVADAPTPSDDQYVSETKFDVSGAGATDYTANDGLTGGLSQENLDKMFVTGDLNGVTVTGTNVVTAAACEKAYGAISTQGPKQFGLKLGSKSAEGSVTLTTSKDISKVVVSVYAWSATKLASIAVNEASAVKLEAADVNAAKTLEFTVTPSKSIKVSSTIYSVFQSIELFSVSAAA